MFGYQRVGADAIRVMFYEAATGKLIGAAEAKIENKRGPIRSLLISPPNGGRSTIQIGRFIMDYAIAG